MMTREEIESQFTPGPWTTGADEDASVIYSPGLDLVADAGRDDGNAELESANARLIAAAPALLGCFLDVYQMILASELPLPLRYKFLQTMALVEPHA
jgi:hypothetical protein